MISFILLNLIVYIDWYASNISENEEYFLSDQYC